MSMPSTTPPAYPARLEVDYEEQHDRVKTLFRVVLVIPIAIVYGILSSGAPGTVYEKGGEAVRPQAAGLPAASSSRRC